MSRRMITNAETDDSDTMEPLNRVSTKILVPHLNINFGVFSCQIKSFYELTALIRKYRIVAFKAGSILLAVYKGSNIMLLHQNKVIKDFFNLYQLCFSATNNSMPTLIPLLEWEGRVKLQLQRSNVRIFLGVVGVAYAVVILFTLYKIAERIFK